MNVKLVSMVRDLNKIITKEEEIIKYFNKKKLFQEVKRLFASQRLKWLLVQWLGHKLSKASA